MRTALEITLGVGLLAIILLQFTSLNEWKAIATAKDAARGMQ